MAVAWRSRIIGHGEEAPHQLLANPLNFRIHPKHQQDALAGVLSEVGWVQDVIVNQQTGHVIDGHLRVSLAISRNEPSIPVVYVDLDEAEEKLILATIDPLSAMAVTDAEKLDELLREVSTDSAAVQAMLSDLAESAGILSDKPTAEDPGAQVDRAEELRAKWGTAPGQLWIIPSAATPGRNHRLLCGDSTERDDVLRLMNGEKADIVFTDPPYGVNVSGKGGNAIAGDISFTAIPFAFDAFDVALGPKGWAYVCGGASNLMLYGKLFEKHFRQLARIIVWDKGKTAVLRHAGYHSCFELVYYGFREGGGGEWWGGRDSDAADDIWRISVDADKDRYHPTQKPIELPARAIRNSSPPGGLVYEPFAGAGATLVAAEQEGRVVYGCEIDPPYLAVCLERLAGMGLEPRLSDG